MKSTPPLAIRSWRRFVAIAGLLIVALVAMIGCSSDSNDEPTKAAEPTTRVIETEKGSVTVPASAERIVVLSGGLAGYLYALDAPVVATDTRVLGVTNLDGGFPPAWADAAKAQGTKELPAGEQLNQHIAHARQVRAGCHLFAIEHLRLDLVVPEFEFPSLVVEGDDLVGRIAVRVQERSQQPAGTEALALIADCAHLPGRRQRRP